VLDWQMLQLQHKAMNAYHNRWCMCAIVSNPESDMPSSHAYDTAIRQHICQPRKAMVYKMSANGVSILI